jgi:CubicO group peptidase (beta-lactamase class C family)
MRVKLPRRLMVLLFIAGGASTTTAVAIAATAAPGDAQLASIPLPHECPDGLTGAWHGVLPVALLFDMRLAVTEGRSGDLVAEIRTHAGTESIAAWMEGPNVRFQSETAPVAFRGVISAGGRSLDGFVQLGSSIVRISLAAVPTDDGRSWMIDWTPLTAREGEFAFDLYIEEDDGGGIGGYFFFRDQRLPGLWGYGLRCADGLITLSEKNLGLEFEGKLDEGGNLLSLVVTGTGGSVPMTFDRMSADQVPEVPDAPEASPRGSSDLSWVEHAPALLDDEWRTARPSEEGLNTEVLGALVTTIGAGELEFTHSILIARRGKLVFEEYFYGFDRETRHDMRSASKTVTSTLVGLAVQEGRIDGSKSAMLPYFQQYRRYDNWDDRKADISVRNLLTMSSGLDANDSDRESVAAEGAYQSQTEQPDWVKLALDAPMIADPGSQPLYGGANPLILGGILANVVDEPVEWFAHRTLFGPLGIDDYRFFLDPTGIPYMGGGMYMRPRDMAKYGQLYLNGGTWNGRRILSEEWIRESWGKYGRLAPLDRNGHQYGYLWWHHQYQVGDRLIETVEARGNGGQYIFVVPSLEMVVVITSGNFQNGRTRQPEEIMQRWVLPAAVGSATGSLKGPR